MYLLMLVSVAIAADESADLFHFIVCRVMDDYMGDLFVANKNKHKIIIMTTVVIFSPRLSGIYTYSTQ